MLTIDTNILVRLLVDVDQDQGVVVRRLAAENILFVLSSVILETAWVLRSSVRADPESINMIFRVLLKTDGIVVEPPETLRHVLDLHAGGMDFADAMHLCHTGTNGPFITFDRDLVRRAKKLMPDASVELAI